MTINGLLAEAVRRDAQSEALVVPHQGVRWRRQQLREEVDALAMDLHALGLEGVA